MDKKKRVSQQNYLVKKHKFKQNLLVFVLVFFSVNSFAGYREVSKKDLIEDIDAYVNYIDHVHADPYRITTREKFVGKAQELKQKIRNLENANISVLECANYLQELSAIIQDGHTRINFPFDQLTGKESVFPLKLKIIDGNVYVLDNLGYESVPNLCSILEINGIPVKTLFEKCCKLYNTSIDHTKYLMFEESFPILLVNYLDISPPWTVKYKMNSQAQIVELKEMTSKAYYKQKTPHSNRYRSYSISVNDVKIPVLDLPGFSYGKAKDYKSFIDTL